MQVHYHMKIMLKDSEQLFEFKKRKYESKTHIAVQYQYYYSLTQFLLFLIYNASNNTMEYAVVNFNNII